MSTKPMKKNPDLPGIRIVNSRRNEQSELIRNLRFEFCYPRRIMTSPSLLSLVVRRLALIAVKFTE